MLLKISSTDRRISGAEEPRAMSVRFATVGFHTLNTFREPSFIAYSFSALVISSMASMNMSAMIFTDMKSQMSPKK